MEGKGESAVLEWRSQKLWTRGSVQRNYGRGAGPKSFNHKITECSLFVWIFTLWMGSYKDKIQIYVILLSRSHKKIYNKAFIISF
jgi:hypothetical protein